MTAEAVGATVTVTGSVAEPLLGQGLDLSIAAKGEQSGDLAALAGTAVPALGAYEAAAKLTQDGSLYRLSDIAASLAGSSLSGVVAVALDGEAPRVAELDLQLQTAGESLADLNETLGQELPALGPYEASFRLRPMGEPFTGQAFRIEDLTARLGESDLAGWVSVDVSQSPPMVAGELSSQKLDIAALASEGDGGDAAGDGGPFVIPDTPLPMPSLQLANAQIALKAGSVLLPNKLTLSDVEVLTVLKDGSLSVEPMVAGLSGGRIEGGINLGAGGGTPNLRLVLVARNIDYGRLLKEQGVDDTVAGTLDLNVDVTGSGASPRSIASGLNGAVVLNGNEGVISNRLLKIVAVGSATFWGRCSATIGMPGSIACWPSSTSRAVWRPGHRWLSTARSSRSPAAAPSICATRAWSWPSIPRLARPASPAWRCRSTLAAR